MIDMTNRTVSLWATLGALVVVSGCSRSFTARHYPAFYDPNLQTVAVVPFKNETNVQGAGILAADSLARALHANGTYRVLSPGQVRSLISQDKLAGLSRTDNQKDADEFRRLGRVQAFITGSVRRDSAISGPYESGYSYPPPEVIDDEYDDNIGDDFEDGFDDGFYYGPYYPYGYWGSPYYDPYYPDYYSQAHVSLDASLVRVSDGTILYSTTAPVQAGADLRSYREILPGTATLDAMNRAATKLVHDLAVVPIEVPIDSQTMLKTASGSRTTGWVFRNKFGSDEETMDVVIQLPPSVAHDTFRLTVTRRGKPDDVIVTKDFRWPQGQTQDAVTLSPRQIADRAGTGGYTVNLHAMGATVMQHHFSIR